MEWAAQIIFAQNIAYSASVSITENKVPSKYEIGIRSFSWKSLSTMWERWQYF